MKSSPMNWTRSRLAWAGLAATAACASMLQPERVVSDEAGCRPEELVLDTVALARATSLDLRGVIPTGEEIEALGDALPDATVDEWLDDPGFADRVVHRHREFLWPNVQGTRVLDFRRALGGSTLIRSTGSIRALYRGDTTAGCDTTGAATTLDANGYAAYRVDGDRRIDGWVEVHPYWDLASTVRVCAFDAQTAAFSRDGVDCRSNDANNDPSCGCGPNLRNCQTSAVQTAILSAMSDEVERRISANIQNDEPYTSLFSSRRAYANGALVHWYRHLAQTSSGLVNAPLGIDVARLPDLPYGTDNWTEIELPTQHAGILTSPMYLTRFQTNRARASHFYDSFLCQPFQPPAGGIPVVQSEQRQPDVQQREGCRYCHSVLEPAASHWGRWAQLGSAWLDPDTFPVMNPICRDCARGEESCPSDCTHYVTRAYSPQEQPYLGELQVYEFLQPQHRPAVDQGPYGLVRDGLSDGRFTHCAVDRTATWLLGEAPSRDSREHQDFVAAFVSSGLRYRDLVKAIVTSDAYRRVR